MQQNDSQQILELMHRALGFISEYQILGFFPLDMFLHLLVGLLLMKLLVTDKRRPWAAFGIVFLCELAKEWFDSYALTATWQESVKDILVTMVYPTFYVAKAIFIRILGSAR